MPGGCPGGWALLDLTHTLRGFINSQKNFPTVNRVSVLCVVTPGKCITLSARRLKPLFATRVLYQCEIVSNDF